MWTKRRGRNKRRILLAEIEPNTYELIFACISSGYEEYRGFLYSLRVAHEAEIRAGTKTRVTAPLYNYDRSAAGVAFKALNFPNNQIYLRTV